MAKILRKALPCTCSDITGLPFLSHCVRDQKDKVRVRELWLSNGGSDFAKFLEPQMATPIIVKAKKK